MSVINEKLYRKLRTNKIFVGSISMLLSQVVTIVSNLFILSMLGRTLSKEMFGLWSILSSFIVIIASFDLGFGQGLRNKLAVLSAKEIESKTKEQHENFFSVFYTLGLVSVIGIIICYVLMPIIPWVKLFNIHEEYLINNIGLIMTVVICNLFFNLPFSLHSSALLAYQETHWRSLMELFQSILLSLVIFISIYLNFSFFEVIVSYFITMSVLVLIRTVIFFNLRGWLLYFHKIGVYLKNIRKLFNISVQFWLLGLSSVLIFSTNSIIVGRVTGLSEAGDFSLIQKLFVLLISVQSTVLTPLWSAYTQASEKGDWVWIKRNFRKTNVLTIVLFGLGGLFFTLFHNIFLEIWIGREINNFPLVISLAIWAFIYALINSTGVLLNGLSNIKLQSLMITLSAILNIPLSIFFGYKYGATGVSIGSIIAIFPLVLSNIIQVKYLLISREKTRSTLP